MDNYTSTSGKVTSELYIVHFKLYITRSGLYLRNLIQSPGSSILFGSWRAEGRLGHIFEPADFVGNKGGMPASSAILG